MHTLILCSFLIPLSVIAPPAKTYKGKVLAAPNVTEAGWKVQEIPGERVGVTATPTDKWEPWDDDGKFPLDVNLAWVRLSITVTKPKLEKLTLYIIDCVSEEDAKKHFTKLRMLRCPDYARSGRYLIKASPEAFKWFTKYYGAERYEVVPETPPKDKK